MAATLVLRFSSIFTTAVVAHIFDRRDFGIFTIALTAYWIITVLGEFGLTSCLIRADLDIDQLAPTLTTFSIVTNAVQAGAMYFFAGQIAAALGSAAAAGPVKVLTVAQVIAGISAVPTCQLIRDFKQKELFRAQLVGTVPSTAILLILAMSGAGPVAYAWSLNIGLLFSTCMIIRSIPRFYAPGLKRSALAVLFKVGLPLGATNIINVILLNVDYALIGHLIGAVALGTYVLAFNIASWPSSLLGNVVKWISIPTFSRVKNDQDLLKDSVTHALRAFSIIVFPMSAIMLALSHCLVVAIYGAKWAASGEVLAILATYGAASVICTLFTNILASLGRTRLAFSIQLLWLVALLPAMTIGVNRKGIVGAAMAHLVVIGLLVFPCYLAALKRTTGVGFIALIKAISPALFAASAAAFAARYAASQFGSPSLQLLAGLAASGIIYVIAVAPQAIELLSRGSFTRSYLIKILRLYNRAVRLIGLRGYIPARHTRLDAGRMRQEKT
jgi:lipopolysaccharide exporter